MKHLWFNLLIMLLLLAGCAPQPWKKDPDVQAAKQDCAGLPQVEHYACIERHAVTSLNPDVCRLAGMWVDDMCLQAVYEAADDPSICDRLYLSGVIPNCHAYYAVRSPKPTPTLLPTAAVSLSGRLIYESGGDIWIIVRGQPPRVLLTDGSSPHLSPDGNRLIFWRAQTESSLPDLWVADFTCPAASAPCQVNERRLVGPAEVGGPLIYGLAWSPDGQTVALTTGAYGKIIYSKDLWLVDVETGDYRHVLDDGGGVPDYSPDGAWIALNMPYTGYQHGQLSLIAADGSSYRPLFDDLIYYEGKWLPDGVLVAGLIRLSQTTEAEDMTELWQVPVAGKPVCLTTIRAGRNFRWSADGQRLAYLADDPAGWLHIAQACTERSECGDGSEPVAVPGTDERTWSHSWSPGGQFLAIIHNEQYFFVPDDPDPALTPMPAPFWLWLDDESYLTAEWIIVDPQADRGHFEVSRAWLDGRREFLFTAENLNGLAYRP
jgi:hypothetical protein